MMESSVIVDIDNESRLMFATNSSGVVLISHFGTIGFSAEEFQYYQCLFKLSDTESTGKLRIGSTSLTSILRRSNFRDDVIEKLLFLSITSISDSSSHDKGYGCSISLSDSEEVDYGQDIHEYVGLTEASNGHKREGGSPSCGDVDSSQYLSLHQWLLLCKLILHLQMNPWAAPDGTLLEVICNLYEVDNQHSIRTDSFTPVPLSPLRTDDIPDDRGIVTEDKFNEGNRISFLEKIDGSNSHGESNYTGNKKWKVPTYGCFANFRLGVAVSTPDMITAARVAGWEVCSEGFHKPYTKFSVSVTTTSCSSDNKNKNIALGGDGDISTATCFRDIVISSDCRGKEAITNMHETLPLTVTARQSLVEPAAAAAAADSDPPLIPLTDSAAVKYTPPSIPATMLTLAIANQDIAVKISTAPVGVKKNKKSAKKKVLAATAAAGGGAVICCVGGTAASATGSKSTLCVTDPAKSLHADPLVVTSAASSSECSSASPSPVPLHLQSEFMGTSSSTSTSALFQKSDKISDASVKLLENEGQTMKEFQQPERDLVQLHSGPPSSSSTSCNRHLNKDYNIGTGCEREREIEKNGNCYGNRREIIAKEGMYGGEMMGQFESQRRYSDFEALVSVLQRLYRGVILPPLPPKTWLTQLQQQTQSAQLFAVQRMAELQLFLSALLAHPLMRHSFEVAMFLRASKEGLNSFRLTFPLLNFDSNGAVIASCKNKNLAKASTGYLSGELYLYLHLFLLHI